MHKICVIMVILGDLPIDLNSACLRHCVVDFKFLTMK